jgi:capsular exopolysaccharide synthesis family protein
VENNLILEEIRRVHEEKRTGILNLKGLHGKKVEIFIREGVIEAASSNLEGRRIGDYLLKEGSLDAAQIGVIQSEAKRRKVCFGEAAVQKKLLDPSDLALAARSQVLDLVDHVVKSGFAVDAFTESLRAQYAPAGVGFPEMHLELCRSNSVPLGPAGDTQLVLATGGDLSAFPWYPQELSILNELRHPGTANELSKRTGISEANVRKILGVLHQLNVVDVAPASDSTSDTALLAASTEFALDTLIPVVTNATLHEKVEVARNESSFTSEQFKNLKVRIRQAESDKPIKVITISSADPQDGKSLVTANLAFSFALDPGRRVVVVDCDLRNPALDKYLGVPAQPGLIQHLGNGYMSPYCYVRRLENLYFLTTGGMAPNPIEILSMRKMKQLIEQLRRDFDTIILDAPPYSPIADAKIVTALSDALVLVVRHGKTSSNSIDHVFSAVDRNKLLGVVFNDVKPMLFHTYQNYNYHYGQYGENQQDAPKISKTASRRNYLEP